MTGAKMKRPLPVCSGRVGLPVNFGPLGPFACTGQPRWTQWFEMIVKLGTCSCGLSGFGTLPLLRTKAVRRLTSPSAASTTNVAMYHWLSGNIEIGPRSTLCCSWPRKDGRSAKPATGSVIRPPIAAPRARVLPSRKTLRVTAVSGTGTRATPCWSAGGAVIPSPASVISRRSGSTTIGSPRSSAVASRAQRMPKTMAITAPIVEISSGLMMSPTRTTTIPIAKPIGQIVGGGRCASSWSDSCSASGLGCSGSTGRSLTANGAAAKRELAQAVLGPAPRDELLDLRAHLDFVGPRAGAFLRPLRGRVDAELAAEELALGGVVEMVERAFGKDHVALRVDVRAGVEEHLLVVVHVDTRVHDDYALREAEHPEAPEGMHHLRRVARELLTDRHDAAVVEHAGDRQVVIDDLGQRRADRGQEDPLRRLAEPGVLLRRLAHHDRGVDRVAPHRHCGDVEDGERLGGGVVAGVVSERPLLADLVLLDVALEHDLRPRRHLDADADALDELDPLAAQEARDHELVDVLRQRGARRVRGDRVEPECDGDLDTPVGGEVVGAAVLVNLPVHEGRLRIDDLHPVHADVAAAALGVMRDHRREGDERRRVAGPATLDRQEAEVHVVAAQDDLLADTLADRLRAGIGDGFELLQAADLLHQPAPRLHLEHVRDPLRGVVELLDAEGEAHSPLGAKLVDQERMLCSLRPPKEQPGSARLDGAVDDLGDLEVGIDLGRDADELALALEQRDPVAEILHRHVASLRRGKPVPRPRAHAGASPSDVRVRRARSPAGRRDRCRASGARPCFPPARPSPRRTGSGGSRRARRESTSASRSLDEEVREARGALPELPPAAHVGTNECRAPAVDERDHGDSLGDRVPVGLVEALEAAAVRPLLPRGLDQLVKCRISEAALVRPARRLEQEAEVVLGVGVARQPAGDPDRGRLDPATGLPRFLGT